MLKSEIPLYLILYDKLIDLSLGMDMIVDFTSSL